MKSDDRDPYHVDELCAHGAGKGCSGSSVATVSFITSFCACQTQPVISSLNPPHGDRRGLPYAFANIWARKHSPASTIAQDLGASWSASATVTNRAGFFAKSATIQSRKTPLRLLTTLQVLDAAPKTSCFRMYRLPCFVMPPSVCLPPLEFWRGVSSIQASEIASRFEHAWVGHAGCDHRGDDFSDAGNLVEQPAPLVLRMNTTDLLLQIFDRLVDSVEDVGPEPSPPPTRLREASYHFRPIRVTRRRDRFPLATTMPNSARWPRRALTLIVCCLISSFGFCAASALLVAPRF